MNLYQNSGKILKKAARILNPGGYLISALMAVGAKKRLLVWLLLLALPLSGCGAKSSSSEETFYLLTKFEWKSDSGEVLRRTTYDYDARGLVVSYQIDFPGQIEAWSEELLVYETELLPCDGVFDQGASFAYDQYGSPISVSGESYGESEYEYTYDSKGRVQSYTSLKTGSAIELEYGKDGTIKSWGSGQSRNETPMIHMETAGLSTERITKMTFSKHAEGVLTCFFEYDNAGNLTEFWYTQGSKEPSGKCTWAYDAQGRLIWGDGFIDGETTFEYEDDRLAAINGEELQYSKGDDGEMVVTYKDYELTYEPIKLTQKEIALARHRWNQFCGVYYGYIHNYTKGLCGIRYPVFDLNTVLLFPRGVI